MTNEIRRAAIYLRSSKDRSDVSIDAQRRELQKLAAEQGTLITQEYKDVVESAKDENRPGFQRLLHDLKSSGRAWNTLMMVDTSRLSRHRYMAQVFKHEARKRNVKIIYSKIPETDPIADLVVIGVMEVFDELHSLMSKEKGLAGMAENVRQGYRAGGRAPKGYKLVKTATGAVRDGEAVTKSHLEPTEEAPIVGRYLKLRAAGIPRKRALDDTGLRVVKTSAVGIEWNALTYAGHTVWNVHNEHIKGSGYKGGTKRRPRSEWVIKENTHEALITTEEAEALVSRLEKKPRGHSRRRRRDYLLSGMLKTPAGEAWYGDGRNGYVPTSTRGQPGRRADRKLLEQAVVDQVMSDLRSPAFIKALTRQATQYYEAHRDDPAQEMRLEARELEGRISRLVHFALELATPGPTLREIERLELRRETLVGEISRLEHETQAASVLANVDESQVDTFLAGVAENMAAVDHEALKDLLGTLIDRITLDPVTRECQVSYQIGVDLRNKVASPRGFDTCASRLILPWAA